MKDLTLVDDKKALESVVGAPGIANDEDLGILGTFEKFVPGSIRKRTKIWPQRFATVEVGPKNSAKSLLVIAHADTNGLRIAKITEDGYLHFQTVGGVSPTHYLSSIVCVWTRCRKSGLLLKTFGVVGWKALHLFGENDRKQVPEPKQLVIDIGAKNQAEVEGLGIRVGDPVTFESGVTYLKNDLIAANGLDNRSGVWVVIESLYKLYQEKLNLRLVFAVAGREEIGLVGAQQIEGQHRPFTFCIGLDVGHAYDYPGVSDLKSMNPDISLGGGPIIYRGSMLDRELVENAIRLAEENKIPCQLDSLPGQIGTDAMVFDRRGVRTIDFGIPCRYMHFKEVVSLSDLKNTANLAVAIINEINNK